MKLPVLSGEKVTRILNKFCFEIDHQTIIHFILRKNKEPFKRITVPNHKTIAPQTLLAIIKQAEISSKEFLKEL